MMTTVDVVSADKFVVIYHSAEKTAPHLSTLFLFVTEKHSVPVLSIHSPLMDVWVVFSLGLL